MFPPIPFQNPQSLADPGALASGPLAGRQSECDARKVRATRSANVSAAPLRTLSLVGRPCASPSRPPAFFCCRQTHADGPRAACHSFAPCWENETRRHANRGLHVYTDHIGGLRSYGAKLKNDRQTHFPFGPRAVSSRRLCQTRSVLQIGLYNGERASGALIQKHSIERLHTSAPRARAWGHFAVRCEQDRKDL